MGEHPVRILREYLAELFIGGIVGDVAALGRLLRLGSSNGRVAPGFFFSVTLNRVSAASLRSFHN